MKLTRSTPSIFVITTVLVMTTAFLPPRLAADDFSFHEAGARAASLGGAFTARADDTAALFYNPAGLAFLGGTRLKTNFTLGGRTMSAAWPDGGSSFRSKPNEILGGHALSWQPVRRVTVAAGLFQVAGFDSLWPSNWSGRSIALHSEFRAHSVRAAVAVEVIKDFAVSVGLDVVKASLAWTHEIRFNFENQPLPEDAILESREKLADNGVGFVAGALWKIIPAVQIGASYRGGVGFDLAGRNIFSYPALLPTLVPGPSGEIVALVDLWERFYRTQEVTGRLTLPREIACGIVLTPSSWLSLHADVVWTGWSKFGEWTFRSVSAEDELSPDWTTVYQEFYGIAPDYGTQGVAFALEDSKRIKAGLEFRPAHYLAVRIGYARHESSVTASNRTPVYPDLDRNVYSVGFGYEGPVFSIWRTTERIADLSFDVFARYSTADPGESAYPGFEMTYSAKRFTWGVGAGFNF